MGPSPAIYARNCEVRRIDRNAAAAFFSANHRLGSTRARYCYGLFVRRTSGAAEMRLEAGTLAAAAGFSGPRRWIKGGRTIASYEWVRYASLEGMRVIGGMSRLLDAFVREIKPGDVMSYADPDEGDGGAAYRKLGFTLEGLVEKPGFKSLKFRKIY